MVKYYEKAQRNFKTDYELTVSLQNDYRMKNPDFMELFDKYEHLVEKQRCKLNSELAKWHLEGLSKEEYQSFAVEKFFLQIPGIRLNEPIVDEHRDTWTMYQRVWGYIVSMNRDILSKSIKDNASATVAGKVKTADGKHIKNKIKVISLEKEIKSKDESLSFGDTVGFEDNTFMERKILHTAMTRMIGDLNDKQRALIQLKQEGKNDRDICDELGVSRNNIREAVSYSKQRLQFWVDACSRKMGYPIGYEDLLAAFN